MENKTNPTAELKKTCVNCGAELRYKPGTTSLICNYCGYKQEIKASNEEIQELELRQYLENMGRGKMVPVYIQRGDKHRILGMVADTPSEWRKHRHSWLYRP